VSQLDPSHSVAVGNNITVPALTVRRASSTIELRDGQSFLLAGLLQNSSTTDQEQLPWLGDVPVLGAVGRASLPARSRDRRQSRRHRLRT
jgi:pilus assembly protein CpaC